MRKGRKGEGRGGEEGKERGQTADIIKIMQLQYTYCATHGCCCSNSKTDSVFSHTHVTNSEKANKIRTPTNNEVQITADP